MFKSKKRYELRTAGDPVLSQIAAPVPEITPEIRELANEMLQHMIVFDGIGLAAPQYGRSLRLIVIDVPCSDEEKEQLTEFEAGMYASMPMVLVNPEIIGRSDTLSEREEGCLSVPGIYAPVIRPEEISFTAKMLDGNVVSGTCGGLLGRCLQHEIDHLDGFLFTDKLSPDAADRISGQLRSLTESGRSRNYRRIIRK